MGKQDFKDLTLAKGEVILKNCDYLSVEAGDFLQHSTLLLTNKRFIHRSISQKKKEKSISIEEVDINDIDSLDYGFMQAKTPINPIIVIISILLLIGGIVLYIVLNKFLTLALSLVGIIVLIIGILVRKKTSAFKIDVISYHAQNDHLCLDEHKDIEDSVENRNSNAIILLVLLVVFGGLGFLAYYFRHLLPNERLLYVIFGALGLLYLSIVGRFLASFKKNSKKVVKVDIPTKEGKGKKKAPKGKKDGNDQVSVEINIDGVLDLINDMGALIINCKK